MGMHGRLRVGAAWRTRPMSSQAVVLCASSTVAANGRTLRRSALAAQHRGASLNTQGCKPPNPGVQADAQGKCAAPPTCSGRRPCL